MTPRNHPDRRATDAGKTTNTIESVLPPPELEPRLSRSTQSAPATPDSVPSPTQARGKAAASEPKAPAYATEPEAISKSYYVEAKGSERRYFDDVQRKALAIRADDSTINSKREDLKTIRAMLTMAESRGWSEVKIAGTAEFKREAWIEAQARGMTTRGYAANDLERQEADRRRAERGPQSSRTEAPARDNELRSASPAPQRTVTPPAPSVAPSQSQAPARSIRPEADTGQAPARQARPAEATQAAPGAEATQTRKAAPAEPGQAPARQSRSGEGAQPAPAAEAAQTRKAAPAEPGQAPARQSRSGEGAQAAPAAEAAQNRKAAPAEAEKAAPQLTAAENHKVAKEATAALSDNGKLVFAAMSEKIDRQMNKLNADGKAEMKAYVATELVKKERAEGPVVLTKEQRQLATTAPEPAQRQQPAAQQATPAPRPVQAPERAAEAPERAARPARDEPEPEQPRRRRSR